MAFSTEELMKSDITDIRHLIGRYFCIKHGATTASVALLSLAHELIMMENVIYCVERIQKLYAFHSDNREMTKKR